MRTAMIGILLASALWTMHSRPADAQTTLPPIDDMLCEKAPPGSVERLPEPFSQWAIVLCTPSGQALGPLIDKDGADGKLTFWLARPGERPFLLQAWPASRPVPQKLTAYDLRFAKFSGGERTGEALEKTLKMWDIGFGETPRPKIDRVFQLDAQSVWNGTIFSLFFYVVDDRPRWMIVCLNACKWSVQIDVVER